MAQSWVIACRSQMVFGCVKNDLLDQTACQIMYVVFMKITNNIHLHWRPNIKAKGLYFQTGTCDVNISSKASRKDSKQSMDVNIVNNYKEVLTSWISGILLGLNAEQCYTSSGGVYSAGDIYRNLQYCAFGCCGPALNRYCCPIIGPIVGICIGAIAFIVILIIIIVCCRKYSEKQIRRRAQMKMHIGKAYKKYIQKTKHVPFQKVQQRNIDEYQ